MSETTEEVKATPGPWRVVSSGAVFTATGFGVIAGAVSDGMDRHPKTHAEIPEDKELTQANGRLLAAAPDLLAALEALRHDHHVLRRHAAKSRDEGRCYEEFCGETNAAIAKARGEPS